MSPNSAEKKAKRAAKRAARAEQKPLVLFEFDWSADRTPHAGVRDEDNEAAFYDVKAVSIEIPRVSRSGKPYRDDGRRMFLASAGPSGPFLHIVFVTFRGKIKPIHARLMNDLELRLYRSR